MGNNASTLMSCAGTTPKKKLHKTITHRNVKTSHSQADVNGSAQHQELEADVNDSNIDEDDDETMLPLDQSDTSPIKLEPSTPLGDLVAEALGSQPCTLVGAEEDFPFVDEEQDVDDMLSQKTYPSEVDIGDKNTTRVRPTTMVTTVLPSRNISSDHHEQPARRELVTVDSSQVEKASSNGELHCCNYHSNESLAR